MRVKVKVKVPSPPLTRRLQAFTMIEIAISVAVIGFALVAIIGVLPLGLNVQKDNREDTIVSQDGQYFMDVIRFGRQGRTQDEGKALDFLTNYVDSITVTKAPSGATTKFVSNVLTNGQVIMDLLCTPRYEPGGNGMITNTVYAIVHGMSGSAIDQYGGNNIVAFKYRMEVQLIPFSTTPLMNDVYTNYLIGITNTTGDSGTVAEEQLRHLQNKLLDLRLICTWPVIGDGSSPGPTKREFRTTVSGALHMAHYDVDPSLVFRLYYIDPQTFTNFTPSLTTEPVGTNMVIN